MPNTTEWHCVDPALCSYLIIIGEHVYRGQRTLYDTIAVWLGDERLTTCSDFEEATKIVFEHVKTLPK